ncbi:MAG TPA: AI-2E family transporter [Armatimonadota bacterium]
MKQQIQAGVLLALIIGAGFLTFQALQKLAPLVVLIAIAVVFTTGIDPLVNRLQAATRRRWQMPRSLATLCVLLLGLLIIISAISFLAYYAVNQAIFVANDEQLQRQLTNWFTHLSERYPVLIPSLTSLLGRLKTQTGQIYSYLWTTTLAIFGLLGTAFSLVLVLVFTFFFTTFKDGICYTLLQFVPQQYQARTRVVGHLAAEKMGGWLRGQITLALIITVIIILGMSILGFPAFAVLTGIIGGLGELIPMVGPYLAFLPALLIILLSEHHTWQVIAAIVFFVLLSQVENYVLAPKIMQRHVSLHPVTVILALFTGGSLFGIVGALLAIPLTAAGRIILLETIFPLIQGKTRRQIENGKPEARAARRDASLRHRKSLPTQSE